MPDKQGKNRRHPPPVKNRWKPGQSGNPKGRPVKAQRIPDILNGIGLQRVEDANLPEPVMRRLKKMKELSMLEAVIHLVYEYALRGNEWAVRFIADRTEGKPKVPVALTDERVTIGIDGENNKEPPDGEEIGTDE